MSQADRLALLLDAKRAYDESAAAISQLAASGVISSAQAAQVLRACMCTSVCSGGVPRSSLVWPLQELKLAQETLDEAKRAALEPGAGHSAGASTAQPGLTGSSTAAQGRDAVTVLAASAAGADPHVRALTCGLCGERGHNKRTCPKAANSEDRESKRKRAAAEPDATVGVDGGAAEQQEEGTCMCVLRCSCYACCMCTFVISRTRWSNP
jgi:hypothetical protein